MFAGRRWFTAKQMSQCPRQQADALFPKLDLRARDRPRIGHELGRQLKECLTDLGRIAHADIGDVWPVGEEFLYGCLAFGRQRLKSFCQDCRIQRRSYFAIAWHDRHSLSRSAIVGGRSICRLLAKPRPCSVLTCYRSSPCRRRAKFSGVDTLSGIAAWPPGG